MSWEKTDWDNSENRHLFEGVEWWTMRVQDDGLFGRVDGQEFSVPLRLIRELIAAHDADRAKGGDR